MKAGLVSISFRKNSVAEVVEMARVAGLSSIEWGGDIHVPHGNLEAARSAAAMTIDHGMQVSAYGSYLRLGSEEGPSIEEVIETASILEAPTVRVWAGRKGSADTTPAVREKVVASALKAADLAQERGMTISYEFHGGTLTDTTASAVELLSETDHPAVRTFWQPPVGQSEEDCLESLAAVLPRLSNVHAFHWWPTSSDRFPLAQGLAPWRKYLAVIQRAGHSPHVSLEFMPDGKPESLPGEAATLTTLLEEI